MYMAEDAYLSWKIAHTLLTEESQAGCRNGVLLDFFAGLCDFLNDNRWQ